MRNYLALGMFLVLGLYVAFVWGLTTPYWTFPFGDDRQFLQWAASPSAPTQWILQSFTFPYAIWFCGKLTSLFTSSTNSLLLLSLISQMGVLILTGFYFWRVTQQAGLTLLAVLMLSISAWPWVYYFFGSYAPFLALCAVASFYLIFLGFKNDSLQYYAWAGVLSGVCVLTHISTMVLVSCLFCLILFTEAKRSLVKKLSVFLVPATFMIGIYMFLFSGVLFKHLGENIASPHFRDALLVFGKTPELGPHSFWLVVGENAPGFSLLFLATLLVFVLTKGVKQLHSPMMRFNLALIGVCVLHGVLIDLLPFTKLGRVHYVVFAPLFWGMGGLLYLNLSSYSLKWVRLIPTLITGWVLVANVSLIHKIKNAKQSLGKYVVSLPSDTQYFVFQKDLHGQSILPKVFNKSIRSIADLSEIPKDQSSPMALFVGPNGMGSGKTFIRHGVLPDFTPPSLPAPSEGLNLPFYSHFPSFLMEEEVTQAFYDEGVMPDDSQMNFTVYTWNL